MANASNAGTDTGCSCKPFSPVTHQFKPFEWVQAERLDGFQQSRAAFLNDARDVVQGAQLLAQLLEWDEDLRDAASSSDAAPAPLFDACQRTSLQRLLSASLGLLHARIEDQCDALTP
mgnify:CR=1 FL=1